MVSHLYIHFPFCASRCGYCDFYSRAGGLELAPAYVEAVGAELGEVTAAHGDDGAGGKVAVHRKTGVVEPTLDTVYLGGGTPTLLGAGLLEEVLSAVRGLCRPGAEVSVEANPAMITPELAERLLAAGVNRVSLGAQSFNPELRRNLGRAGPVAAIERAFTSLRDAGCGNIGLDLMFSIPGQTSADLDHDLERALALAPEHLSCYELTVKAGSEFQQRWRGELEAVSRLGGDFYRTVVDRLTGAGYRWYETSNFALPSRECRHNLGYWRGEDFIGLGAGAWSSLGSRRWRNVEDTEAYIAAAGGDWEGVRRYEQLDRRQRLYERLLLGLRCDQGVERATVAGAIDAEQENILLRNGFLLNEGGRILLTRRGRFVANEVCARLLRDEAQVRPPEKH